MKQRNIHVTEMTPAGKIFKEADAILIDPEASATEKIEALGKMDVAAGLNTAKPGSPLTIKDVNVYLKHRTSDDDIVDKIMHGKTKKERQANFLSAVRNILED